MDKLPKKLILIDGTCNLCHSSVKFIERTARKPDFYYANLQSELGQYLLKKYKLSTDLNTVVFIENGEAFTKSSAALRVTMHLKFPYPLLVLFYPIPAFLRNVVYNYIAKNRYRWFGEKESCKLPLPELTRRVLN